MNRHSRLKIACPACAQKLDVTGYEPFEEVGCPTCGCTILVPRLFGGFLLEEIIGRGGMAVVYRALDLTLHRDVAIKVLDEDIAAQEGASEQFLREGRAAAAISHINVVPIYSSGEAEDLPYLVMQYMEGLSLDRQMQRIEGKVSMDFCLRIAGEAARGLEAALREGIIHHDVKPANILLDADGVAKVADFGLAQLLHDDIAHPPERDQWATPYYVSPERVRTGREDYRGDIYSLGATLYHLFAGEAPFKGGSERAIMDARLEVEPRPLQELRRDVPPAVARTIHAMLSRDRDSRPQDYGIICDCMEQARREVSERADAAAGGGAAALRPTRRTGGKFPRLVVRDNEGVRERIANYRFAARRYQKRGLGVMDWLLVVSMAGILLFLLISRFASRDDEPPSKPQQPNPAVVATNRPRPADYDFRALRTEIEDYLNVLSPQKRELERARLKMLIGTRSHLANALNRMGYELPADGLLLRDGGRHTGRMLTVNADRFELLPANGGGAVTVRWSQLAVQQVLDLYDYLIEKWDETGGGGSRSPYAALEALRAAVFCEWYGRTDRVKAYVAQALELDPKVRPDAREIFPSLVPDS